MKIVIVGKGGVGKTTVAACLARLVGRDGYSVIAVDADPSLNLAKALGIAPSAASSKPVLFDEEFIKERTLLPNGAYRLNPRVEDVIERFGIRGPDNVTLLKLGYVKKGGVRCLCPEYAFLRALLSHLILGRKDVVIVDMVAGLEPMSRGAARGVDLMLCVTEPTAKSIDVTQEIYRLSKDIGVKNFTVIGNKVMSEEDKVFIEKALSDVKILGHLPYDENVVKADRLGVAVLDYNPSSPIVLELNKIKKIILNFMTSKKP
ncbi:MAG: AAA family ATPase [Ignisphaera sp.]|jgi:CO dehydrogenase maturation factor|nr:AAA family ATPase [Ignisphaera sp.]MCC6055583.1 AAA family ATPase [Desulfurococcaceae archaeon]